MLTKIKNFLHITILMNIYSFRNLLTGNGAVWLKLDTTDLESMSEKIVRHKSLQLDSKKVLDLGCGTGTMLHYLQREKNCSPYGVDVIRLNIHQCRKKMESGNFYRQDIIKYLDETTDKFDLIILYGVIGCFPVSKQREIIDKISKIMNKGSVLWIGANIYEDSNYKFQTYPVPRGFYDNICTEIPSLELEEIEEKDIFGKVKYDQNQTTVLLTKTV